jgi:hypothetical protein
LIYKETILRRKVDLGLGANINTVKQIKQHAAYFNGKTASKEDQRSCVCSQALPGIQKALCSTPSTEKEKILKREDLF